MIILASQSQTRRDMLRNAGVAFRAVSPDFNEAHFIAQIRQPDPAMLSLTLAKEKARIVAKQNPATLVIGADQTLGLDGSVFQKPTTRADAKKQLLALRGKTHNLHTSGVTYRDATELWSTTVTSTLTMRNFSDAWLDNYLDQCGDGILQSVGAYQIENKGLQCFEHVDGDYFAILGLPMLPLLHHLRAEGQLTS